MTPRAGTTLARRRRRRGAALLMAMITVSLVATFAAAALWQQWRDVEVETAERARVQSSWVLTGALDWARLLLREDGRTSVDHLGEPWAVPLQEARLSSFLAAERNVATDVDPQVMEAFLSGRITDLQSMLNVTNLVDNGKLSDDALESFSRLFDLLALPADQLDRLAENLRFALDTSGNNRSSALAPLVPQRIEQLVWLGLPETTVAALRPYVTVLPRRTNINLNTASAEVIYASIHGLDMAQAQSLVTARERAHFRAVSDAGRLLTGGAAALPEGRYAIGVASDFFEVQARLRLDALVVQERSVLRREGMQVLVLQRERGDADATALAPAGAPR